MGAFLTTLDSKEQNPLSVLIIGCGNIAGGFDRGRSNDDLPYSHAGAYTRDGRFLLAGCVDPDEGKRTQFMAEWSINLGFNSIEDFIVRNSSFDVISICSPTNCHANNLISALLLSPKLVFCEKPVTTRLHLTENIVEEYSKSKVHLMVNHNRRWDPEVMKFRNQMYEGEWGELRAINGIYNKGILNNGIHMIDLLRFLIGPMKIEAVGKGFKDFYKEDPTIPVWLSDGNGVPIQLSCGHAADYAVFELQFIFSKGIVTIEDGGQYWRKRKIISSEIIKGYNILNQGVLVNGGDAQSMKFAVNNLYNVIKSNEPLASSGLTSLEAQKICEEIRELSECP